MHFTDGSNSGISDDANVSRSNCEIKRYLNWLCSGA